MDELKALDALLGLGILGSLLDPNGVKPPDIEKFKAQAEAKRDEVRRNARDFTLRDADRRRPRQRRYMMPISRPGSLIHRRLS